MNYAYYKVVTQKQKPRGVFVQITGKQNYKNISGMFNNATGGGQDNSTDPGPKRDPNNFLAPIFGNDLFTSLASVAAILIVIILILVSVRLLKREL